MENEASGKFRTSLFGGFNRKDVIDYIEEVYAEINKDQQEREAIQSHYEALEERLKEAEEALRVHDETKAVRVVPVKVGAGHRVKIRRRVNGKRK